MSGGGDGTIVFEDEKSQEEQTTAVKDYDNDTRWIVVANSDPKQPQQKQHQDGTEKKQNAEDNEENEDSCAPLLPDTLSIPTDNNSVHSFDGMSALTINTHIPVTPGTTIGRKKDNENKENNKDNWAGNDDDKQEQHRKQQPLASLIHNATTKIMNDAWNVTTNMVADLVHDTMEDMTQKRDSSSSTTIIFEIVKNGIRDILGNGEEVFQNNHNSKDDDDKDSSSRKTTPPTTTIKKMNQVWNTMDSFLTNFMDKGEK